MRSRDVAAWLGEQHDDSFFNVGCVFGLDAENYLRICLHPKLVRSKFEISQLPERYMTEANLVSVIELRATNESVRPLFLQPLLCSDALFLNIDRPECHPLRALAAGRVAFAGGGIDHIDLVSVASCTPQGTHRVAEWHDAFRESARRIGEDDDARRHHGAVMLLANYKEIETQPAGLSGVFVPHRLAHAPLHQHVVLSAYGRNTVRAEHSLRWFADDELQKWEGFETFGYVAALKRKSAPATVFRFKLQRLGGDARAWNAPTLPVAISVSDAVRVPTPRASWRFAERGTP